MGRMAVHLIRQRHGGTGPARGHALDLGFALRARESTAGRRG